jgi:hypothetical protein
VHDEDLERALNESLLNKIEIAEAKQFDMYQDEEEMLRIALEESLKSAVPKEYDEDEAMMRAIAASLYKT